jgi:hypothetical protein
MVKRRAIGQEQKLVRKRAVTWDWASQRKFVEYPGDSGSESYTESMSWEDELEQAFFPVAANPEAGMKLVLAAFGVPAFARRARAVEDAILSLRCKCELQRERWLPMVRLCLARLNALAGDWDTLCPLLADGTAPARLALLHARLEPRLQVAVNRTHSHRQLRTALRELNQSIDRFNQRWAAFLHAVDLAPINSLIAGYNRYYVLEKECVLRSIRLAMIGFQPLERWTREQLATEFPLLPTFLLTS